VYFVLSEVDKLQCQFTRVQILPVPRSGAGCGALTQGSSIRMSSDALPALRRKIEPNSSTGQAYRTRFRPPATTRIAQADDLPLDFFGGALNEQFLIQSGRTLFRRNAHTVRRIGKRSTLFLNSFSSNPGSVT
jgi:hypothetical protein